MIFAVSAVTRERALYRDSITLMDRYLFWKPSRLVGKAGGDENLAALYEAKSRVQPGTSCSLTFLNNDEGGKYRMGERHIEQNSNYRRESTKTSTSSPRSKENFNRLARNWLKRFKDARSHRTIWSRESHHCLSVREEFSYATLFLGSLILLLM